VAKLTAADCPDWLALALSCPECGRGLILTRSGGMSCFKNPGHTGLILESEWRDRVTAAYAAAYGSNRTTIRRDEAQEIAKKWLAAPLSEREKKAD
jgi:hypothetical protein